MSLVATFVAVSIFVASVVIVSLFLKLHVCVHAFQCNCSIITFLRPIARIFERGVLFLGRGGGLLTQFSLIIH